MDDGELTLAINGAKLAGWTDVRVTRSIERCPNDFDIAFTERFPDQANALVAQAGDACQVMIGGDVVITGYVDRFMPTISTDRHTVRIVGRGKCQDMVDCAAEWPNSQITGATVAEIAQKLAKPYGITVLVEGEVGPPIPQFNINFGETAWEIIEQICRYRGLLVYETPKGEVFIGPIGESIASSGFQQGINVLAADFAQAVDQRFSEYRVVRQGMDVLGDVGEGGNLVTTAKDVGVKRHRMKGIIAETTALGAGLNVAEKRGVWEAARRAARGNKVEITADSWRDGAGALWAPNTTASIRLPALKLEDRTWLIGEVTYLRDAQGTRATITLMPPDGFKPEPILLQPFAPDIKGVDEK